MRVEHKSVLRVPSASDQALEHRARQGDVDAFGELVQRYTCPVSYMIAHRVADPFEVERRVIEVFCATWRDLQHPPCPRRGFLGTLSHAVARNIAGLDPRERP